MNTSTLSSTPTLDVLLKEVVDSGASDLHLSVGSAPIMRINGELTRSMYQPLNKDECQTLIFTMLNNEQRRTLEQNWELDFAYGMKGIGRFRVNVYREKGNYATAIRTINPITPSFESLGLPEVCRELCHRTKGLILVTGPTGSGKSTTLAAMIDYINATKSEHILTIEDPVEFVHRSKKSIVHQRELGADTKSFGNALKSALREDPDVILLGELRDLETMALAISAAETGHIVFGTLHTSSAMQTVDRIVDAFPAAQQQQIRVQLSSSLVAVMSQVLLPKLNEFGEHQGRILAQEIMLVTPAIANLVREGKTPQIYSSIQTGAESGMTTMENTLYRLISSNQITYEDALRKSSRPEELKRLMGYR
jgi:twitching motility protein PilT